MSRFQNLRKFGTKVLKYKQGKCVNNDECFFANINSSLKKEGFNYGTGVCAALTMMFLSDFLHNANFGPLVDLSPFSTRFRASQGIKSGNEYDIKIAAEAVSLQNGYTSASKLSGEENALDKIAKQMNLSRAAFLLPPGTNAKTATDIVGIGKALTSSVGALIGYDIKKPDGKTSGHAIGLTKTMTEIFFFDPNVGGYLVLPDKMGLFVDAYVACLLPDWTITGVRAPLFYAKS